MFIRQKALLILLILIFTLSACKKPIQQTNSIHEKTNEQSRNDTTTSTVKAEKDYKIKITVDGKEIKEYSIEDIKKLEKKSVDFSKESGPALIDVLKNAGINGFSRIILKNSDEFTQTLLKEDISETTLIGVTKEGTAILVSNLMMENEFIKNIIEIEVHLQAKTEITKAPTFYPRSSYYGEIYKPWGALQIVFTKAVNSFDGEKVTLKDAKGNSIKIKSTSIIDEENEIILIEPEEALSNGQRYTLFIPKGTIISIEGEKHDRDIDVTFTVKK